MWNLDTSRLSTNTSTLLFNRNFRELVSFWPVTCKLLACKISLHWSLSLPISCMGSQQASQAVLLSGTKACSPSLSQSPFSRRGPWLAPIYPGRGYFPSLPAMKYFMGTERRKPSLCLLPVGLVLFFPLFSQKPFSLGLTWLSPLR